MRINKKQSKKTGSLVYPQWDFRQGYAHEATGLCMIPADCEGRVKTEHLTVKSITYKELAFIGTVNKQQGN